MARVQKQESHESESHSPDIDSPGHQLPQTRDTPKGDQDATIDINEIDHDVPLIEVQGARHRTHTNRRMSKEHIERIKRRHRRERLLVRLDLALFAVVCLGGAVILIGLQALQ
ncbi:hypothetical protein [Bifidobacterium sp. UTBIF-78]|uniref:hypothetical protein n=1 Tax=Bifidobacterium sp. UTBIF-78 TaxID=1465263 RepID=UPI00112A7262|nr:hypothetical protein [Bifidobacterium sp. UTBIF-78]TPF93377.1 hypothetical protein BG22_07375 [Bifidobacterium sp. UTBIF-78]